MKNRINLNALILFTMAMLAVGCQKDYETLHAELVDKSPIESIKKAKTSVHHRGLFVFSSMIF